MLPVSQLPTRGRAWAAPSARLRRLADRIGIARDRVEHAVSRGPAAPMTLRLIQAWGADLLYSCTLLLGSTWYIKRANWLNKKI